MKHAPVWYPPAFPVEGRLPQSVNQVQENILRQCELEQGYHDALCLAAGYRVTPPCCKTLHISLFFDGTGNNLNNDLITATTPHPTNIARLFRATIGEGIAGGTGHLGQRAEDLTDAEGTGYGQYFKYYMPGVGTPFVEVGDLDYTTLGLAGGRLGEERINWALLMIIDALRRTLGQPRLDNEALRVAVKAMGTWVGMGAATGRTNRASQFARQIKALEKPLRSALVQPQPGQSKLLGIKLYVYGFSRGAAAARAFVSWLNELLRGRSLFKVGDLELPVSVEYLGVLDTVASVGIADLLPGASGHMGWADGNQELPSSGLVKRCLHVVASHEQRLCFPLESVRRQGGLYPANCHEVIYPGVHSDIGGGYPPGDQGKAVGRDDRSLLSQVVLHDLYADAFTFGAPFKVPENAVPVGIYFDRWRIMDPDIAGQFSISPELITRLNAWRKLTLNLPGPQLSSGEQSTQYRPIPAETILEHALRSQMGWLTAWRIDRYAFASLHDSPFYRQSTDTHTDPMERKRAEQNRNDQQSRIEKRRKEQLALERDSYWPRIPLEPGIADFDPDIAKTQLREAAQEFAVAYRDPKRLVSSLHPLVSAKSAPAFVMRIITADARLEGQQMKADAQGKVRRLFPPLSGYRSHLDENTRGFVDELRNATLAEGLLRSLFDDQVHDSRAWFLYSLGREPLGSYFRERMVFFGEASRREVAMHTESDATCVAGMEKCMKPEHIAQAQQAIKNRWEAYHAAAKEVTDGLA